MGKFSLITALTLNSAGYEKGINKAKQSTAKYQSAVKKANKDVKSSFKGVMPSIGLLNGQMGGLAHGVQGAGKAVMSLIPMMKGLKMAIIGTGIGAILIAVTTAISALNSYLKGTKEGADKLNKVLNIAKGAFTAILNRVQLLGEAISLVFQGKFKEAGETLKKAFDGGILDEIKESAEKAGQYAERENKLKKEKIAFLVQEAQLNREIADLKLKAQETRDTDPVTAQKSLNKALQLQNQLSNEKVRLAREEWQITKDNNALGNNSYEDDQKEAELQVAMLNADKERADRSRELVSMGKEVANKIKQQEQATLDAKKALEDFNAEMAKTAELQAKALQENFFKGIEEDLENLIDEMDDEKFEPVQFITADSIAKDIDTLTYLELKFKEVMQQMRDESLTTGQIMYESLTKATTALADSLKQGAESFEEFGKSALSAIKSIIGGLIAEGIAAAITKALSNPALSVAPWLIPVIAGGAAGLAKTAFNSLIPKFQTGGIVGGSSFSGDRVPALVNSGEMILNRGQQQNLFKQINSGVGGGEVTFRIEGDTLVGILNKQNRKYSIY